MNWKRILRRRRSENELEEEINAHLAIETHQRLDRGESPDEARRNARRDFGNIALVKEATRRAWGAAFVDRLELDIRHAARFTAKMFRREFSSTMAVVITLALAIAANTTIFAFVNGLLLKARPGIEHQKELVYLSRTLNGQTDSISYPNFVDYRDRNDIFSGLCAYWDSLVTYSLRREGTAVKAVSAMPVSGNFFEVLGTKPALGRFFLPNEDKPEAAPVAVISYNLWRNSFQADPATVGAEVLINGHAVRIAGVAPRDFYGVNFLRGEMWIPLSMHRILRPERDNLNDRRASTVMVMGRLKAGVTIQQAGSAMSLLASQLEQFYPDKNRGIGVRVEAYSPYPAQLQFGLSLLMGILMVMAALFLLTACANVTAIFIARAANRTREIAVRLSIGASRLHIARQLISETVALFMVAAGGGVLLAGWLMSYLAARQQVLLPFSASIDWSPDVRVSIYTIALTLIAALASSVAPAIHVTRTDIVTALKEESLTSRLRRSRLGNAFVVFEIAISLVLMVAAGGSIQSYLEQARTVRPGFDPADLDAISLDLSIAGYTPSSGAAFSHRLIGRISALPGVQGAAFGRDLPLDGASPTVAFNVVGHQPAANEDSFRADSSSVTPGYFQTMKIPILQGREFSEADSDQSERVAVINDVMARQFWPDASAIGQFFSLGTGSEGRQVKVVGVVKSVNNRHMTDVPVPSIYVPLAQRYAPRGYLFVRGAGAHAAAASLRAVINEMDPNLPVLAVQSLDDVVAFGLMPFRVLLWSGSTLGALSLLLASLGIYGVTAFLVSSRTREIGVRTALGARPLDVLRLVIRQGLILTMAGVLIGGVLSLGIGRALAAVMKSDRGTDVTILAIMTAILILCTVAATCIPARRAGRVDPVVALRTD